MHKTLTMANFLLQEALDVVHVSREDQESVLAMLAAVLWLGNVSFAVIDNENHVEPVADEGNKYSKRMNFKHFHDCLSILLIIYLGWG